MGKFIILICFSFCSFIESAKILGVFPVPSISHQVIYQPIWRELALKGHDVTVISPNILGENIPNLREIDVSFVYPMANNMTKELSKSGSALGHFVWSQRWLEEVLEAEIQCPEVQDILNDQNAHFDIVIVELYNLLPLGFAARFKSPVIGIVSLFMGLHLHYAIGNPVHPVFTPDYFNTYNLNPHESTIWDRINSVIYNAAHRIVYYSRVLPETNKKLHKYFGHHLPSILELETNISILLSNSNAVMNSVTPVVPSAIEISQMHIKPRQPLPMDINEFLEKSDKSVIYMSFGSNVKSASLSSNLLDILKEALSELPYNIIWKWESEQMPNQPKNVFVKKWLPQQDILGHPKVKVFITQGGIQSIEEAISNGVPMVGIPFMGDQHLNIKRIVNLNIGRKLDHSTITKEDFKDAILDVATNKNYEKTIKRMQKIISDTPMTGLQKAVWWIEYVIRHKGAAHLRSPILNMPFYKYYLLDVLLIFIFTFLFVIFIIKKSYHLVFGQKNKKYKQH